MTSGGLRGWMAWVAPLVFVLLWSTGFLSAKYGMPYAEPFTFLGYRFTLTAIGFVLVLAAMRVRLPRDPVIWFHAVVVGVLMHGIYLGGVFVAIDGGTSGGVAALIVGVQPVLTAVLAGVLLSERLSPRAWAGLVLGFAGVAMVVWRQADTGGDWLGIVALLCSLVGITAATLYQKRFAGAIDLRVGSAVQFAAAAVVMWVLAVGTETMIVDWNVESISAMVWSVTVLSFGAVTLLYVLIRHGAASKVASLFYLVPPVVAIETYFLFGETLGPVALGGMAATALGVAMVTRG